MMAGVTEAACLVDHSQRIRLWTPPAVEVLGYQSEEVLGRQCYEVLRSRDCDGHPFCRRDCPVQRAAASGEGNLAVDRDSDNLDSIQIVITGRDAVKVIAYGIQGNSSVMPPGASQNVHVWWVKPLSAVPPTQCSVPHANSIS